MSEDPKRRIEAFIQAASRLARTAPSGRILLARLAAQVDPAWIPEPAREPARARLEAAREAATQPLEPAAVEAVLKQAWDAPSADELDALEPEPVAVTPTAQVHRGVVDGAPVAIKVLRPGLSRWCARTWRAREPAGAARRGIPRLDGPAMLRELRERVLDELDLEHEAGVQRRVSRALRNHPFLTVPAPVMRLCHEQVLVSEWVEGVALSRVSDQAELDLAAGRLAGFVLGGVRAGIVHAGLDPDDVLLTSDGRLAVLDFGAAFAVEPRRAEPALAIVEAFAPRGDGVALGNALAELGLLDARTAATLEWARAVLGELGGEEPSGSTRRSPARRGAARSERQVACRLVMAGNVPAGELWPRGRSLRRSGRSRGSARPRRGGSSAGARSGTAGTRTSARRRGQAARLTIPRDRRGFGAVDHRGDPRIRRASQSSATGVPATAPLMWSTPPRVTYSRDVGAERLPVVEQLPALLEGDDLVAPRVMQQHGRLRRDPAEPVLAQPRAPLRELEHVRVGQSEASTKCGPRTAAWSTFELRSCSIPARPRGSDGDRAPAPGRRRRSRSRRRR